MYKIILIDDDTKELEKIRRTIKANEPENCTFNKDYCFENYSIENFKDEDDFVDKICDDIYAKTVSLYIIDYKILTSKSFFKGNEIFNKVCLKVQDFPIIILTERVEESKIDDLVDADKIYEKSKFFKLEEEYAKTKVANLFYNMKRYQNKLVLLEDKLSNYIEKMEKVGINQELMSMITELEMELSKLLPFKMSMSEKFYDFEKLKEVVQLLDEASKMIEE